ncbi:hypothetical protein RHSIM_Rhsim01G0254800 [Rhododendron simsii]|uniref:UBA domain-containing protein n=1 Tax=Rhododendron simsii TaxID=118357 RepID=A0A834HGX6_RHOSS|nr:hypothetical protein RHSIM_Rhsim01G0254800 [Rhododendron simsii]
MSAPESVSPVDKPREEKNERRDFHVTDGAMRSTPLPIKWPLSLRVAGSSPKARDMDPRSSLCSSHATNASAFDRDGQNSFIVLFLSPDINPSLSLSLSLSLSRVRDDRGLRFALSVFVRNSNGFWKSLEGILSTLLPVSGMPEMAVPQVNKRLLGELQEMGFPLAQATRALHFSDNSSIDAAVNWLFDHQNDPDIDQMPLVPVNIEIETSDPSSVAEEEKLKAQELRDRVRIKKENEEKKLERESEKERRRSGKELLEAKSNQAENERKRFVMRLSYPKSYHWGAVVTWIQNPRLPEARGQDGVDEVKVTSRRTSPTSVGKAERRRMLGLPVEDPPPSIKSASNLMQQEKVSLPVKFVTVPTTELMVNCLRSLKRNHKDDGTKARRAFQTLLIYVRNVAMNPDEEKFRKIRISNPAFQSYHDYFGFLLDRARRNGRYGEVGFLKWLKAVLQLVATEHLSIFDMEEAIWPRTLGCPRDELFNVLCLLGLHGGTGLWNDATILYPKLQERVGNMKEGTEFLELCGFERDGGKFLFLPRDKVDMEVLKSAGTALNSAITNPFFGLLSK